MGGATSTWGLKQHSKTTLIINDKNNIQSYGDANKVVKCFPFWNSDLGH